MKSVHWCGVVGLSLLLLLGCASTPPSSFYVLTPIPEATARNGDISGGGVSLGLGPVVFPQFMDRPQLVTRGGSNRLDVDEFNRWGGTVQDDFLRVWGENLSGRADRQAVAAQSEAVVAAMSRCLGEFSRDVAQVIRTTPPVQPPAATVSPTPSNATWAR